MLLPCIYGSAGVGAVARDGERRSSQVGLAAGDFEVRLLRFARDLVEVAELVTACGCLPLRGATHARRAFLVSGARGDDEVW